VVRKKEREKVGAENSAMKNGNREKTHGEARRLERTTNSGKNINDKKTRRQISLDWPNRRGAAIANLEKRERSKNPW